MLLNKIPVLDEGYAALISSSLPHLKYQDVVDEFFGAKDHQQLKTVAYATLAIKSPIFVQLYIAQMGFTLVSSRLNQLAAYKPSVGEIGGKDHNTNMDISDDIARTTEALLINPSAYQADGCEPFISQIILPISTYATFIVGGTLKQWMEFYQNKNVPAPIKAYKNAIEQIIKAEWKNV